MNTSAQSPKTSVPSTAPALPDSDPNSPANIQRRQTLKIAERSADGRLLKGSKLPGTGRKPGHTVVTLARMWTEEAIDLLGSILTDEKAPPAARCTAAQALLERGWGKAPIQIDTTVRAKFDDFLRDVGASVKARQERERVAAQVVTDVVATVIIRAATDDHVQGVDENDCASVG